MHYTFLHVIVIVYIFHLQLVAILQQNGHYKKLFVDCEVLLVKNFALNALVT